MACRSVHLKLKLKFIYLFSLVGEFNDNFPPPVNNNETILHILSLLLLLLYEKFCRWWLFNVSPTGVDLFCIVFWQSLHRGRLFVSAASLVTLHQFPMNVGQVLLSFYCPSISWRSSDISWATFRNGSLIMFTWGWWWGCKCKRKT